MADKSRIISRPVAGLRTRFSPKSRVGQGLISMAPWLDIVVLIIFFVLIDSKIVLQPGVMIDLPTAPRIEASRSDLVAVIKAVPRIDSKQREEIVFFYDERFVLDSPDRLERLKTRLGEQALKHAGQDLIILADQRVHHGTIVTLYELARSAGIERINVAVKARE